MNINQARLLHFRPNLSGNRDKVWIKRWSCNLFLFVFKITFWSIEFIYLTTLLGNKSKIHKFFLSISHPLQTKQKKDTYFFYGFPSFPSYKPNIIPLLSTKHNLNSLTYLFCQVIYFEQESWDRREGSDESRRP